MLSIISMKQNSWKRTKMKWGRVDWNGLTFSILAIWQTQWMDSKGKFDDMVTHEFFWWYVEHPPIGWVRVVAGGKNLRSTVIEFKISYDNNTPPCD